MEFRLQLLAEAGVIEPDIYQGMLKVVKQLERRWKLPIRNPQGEMLITHMANALMRARRGEEIAGLDTALLEEITASAEFERIEQINQQLLAEFDISIPETEMGYLLTNLYSLYITIQQ